MITKIKPCKGINKAKGYDACNKPSAFRKFGLCPSCLYDWMTNTELGKIYYKKQFLPKVSKATQKQIKNEDKALKIKLTDWKPKLQTKINEIVRLIDIGQPCLARKHHAKQIHAGHIYSRGSSPTIKFNLHNIHRQSAQSNHFQNEDGLLREGLVNEYGKDYMEFISELRRTPALKYSNDEYRDFYLKASKIALRIKKEGKTNDRIDRIVLRNEINLELGVYQKEFCFYYIHIC